MRNAIKKPRKRLRPIAIVVLLLIPIIAVVVMLYKFNIIPHKSYSGEDFDIVAYKSKVDMDSDGVDDQTDILQNVRKYIATDPKYMSKYYATGFPDDEYGVCTDVVAFGMLDAGYDLMTLVNEDVTNNRDDYKIEKIDKNIDFRRVRNLYIYFQNTAISLTTDTSKIDEWHGGDIVVYEKHIAIVSDKRNKRGKPFIIHNAHPSQASYEEDALELCGEILGHYRIS